MWKAEMSVGGSGGGWEGGGRKAGRSAQLIGSLSTRFSTAPPCKRVVRNWFGGCWGAFRGNCREGRSVASQQIAVAMVCFCVKAGSAMRKPFSLRRFKGAPGRCAPGVSIAFSTEFSTFSTWPETKSPPACANGLGGGWARRRGAGPGQLRSPVVRPSFSTSALRAVAVSGSPPL